MSDELQPLTGVIMVDGANMAIKLDTDGKERVDFQALEKALAAHVEREEGRPVVWSYKQVYRTFRSGPLTDAYVGFSTYLRHAGWTLDERPAKRMRDGRWIDKGSDLSLALDAHALVLRGYVSLVAVITNDSDFAALFERLPSETKMYSVCWRDRMPVELRQIAKPIYLEDIWNDIKVVPFLLGDGEAD